jgi:hypothetical protein
MFWGMILALTALLLQFPAIPQSLNLGTLSSTAEASAPETTPRAVTDAPENEDLTSEAPAADGLILNSNQPARGSRATALSLSRGSGSQDRSRERRRREWLALSIDATWRRYL